MKKRFALLTALLMAASLGLAACGGGTSSDAPAATPAPAKTDAPAANNAPAAEPEGENFNATGMPIVNEPVTLNVTTMRWGNMGDSFKGNTWLQDLEARSNVKINWTAVSNEGWDEARSLMLLSGDVPDVFIGNQTIQDGHVMAYLSLFRDLTPYIEQYMPKYKEAIAAIPMLQKITTYPDGGIYSLAKNLPARPMTRNQLIINSDWLDAVHLSAPTDLQSFEEMLRAFKEGDPNGNGVADEIPFTFNSFITKDFYSMFGITDINSADMVMKNGNPVYYATMEEYRDAIRWMNRLHTEGLIDQVGFTQSWEERGNKLRNSEIPLVGVVYAWSYDAETGQWADQYDIYPPIKGPNGQQYAEGDPDGVYSLMRNEAHITAKCAQPEVAARWLDEFYDFEASIQNFWGPLGVVITAESNGTYSLNNPPEGTSADAWYWDQSLRDFGPKYIPPGYSDKINLDPSKGDGRKLQDSKMADPFIMGQYPLVIFTPQESEALAITGSEIGAYVMQMQGQWITQGGVDEEWDAYLAQLDAMGLQDFVQIKVDAYNRFK